MADTKIDTSKTDTGKTDEKAASDSAAETGVAQERNPIEEARAKAAEEQAKVKVVRRFADGSSEWSTFGELADTHGDPTVGPSTADLNPAYSPLASTHAGAAE